MDFHLTLVNTLTRPEWLLLSALLIAAVPLAVAATPSDSIEIEYEKFVLDNGLTLVVHGDRKAPIVSVNVWYHVGSKNEKRGKTGFAHLFEHLMFNGSENFNDDYFQAMERVGATDLNGTTNNDRTNYFQNVPTPALDIALWMESDRMGHLLGAIDQGKLDEQRGVVQNEKRQGENQPYAIASDLIIKNTFPANHPYSWTVIGEMEDLDAASLDDVHEWFKTYYGAANATIVIAGDIDAATAKAKVEKYFGDIPAGKPVPHQRAWIAKRQGSHRQTVQDRVPQARIYKVWNVPNWGTREAVHLDLATDVLALGKTSRFYKRLVYEDQIATAVRASIYGREISGQVTIAGTAHPGGDLAAVEKTLDEELARFIKEGPTEEELAKIKTRNRARFVRGVERIGGFGGKSDILAQNEVYGGSPDYYKKTLAWGQEATAEDLRLAAEKWLTDGVYALEVHPYPQFTESKPGADRTKLPDVSGYPTLDLPELQRATLKNGLKVILAERHEVPTVELSLIVNAGYAADQFASPGTASLAMAMIDEGTKTRTSLEISEDLDNLAANLSAGAGLDTCTVGLSALKEHLADSLDIFADVILNPSFPEKDLERLKKQQLARIQQEKSTPFSIALRLLPGLVFGSEHAYGAPLTGSGTEEAVSALTRADLEKFHKTWFQPGNATLTVAGDTTLDKIVDKLNAELADWADSSAVPVKKLDKVAAPEKRTVYMVDKPGAEQSIIIAGLVAPPTNNPDEIAIETMNAILGGTFTSRINMNLREDKHWAYGARSMFLDAQGQRLFLGYAPVQTDKTKESIIEMDKELREILGERPPTAEELKKAQANQTLRLPGRFETKRSLLGAMREILVYGVEEDYYETYPSKVSELSLDEISAAAKKTVMPDRMVWIVVGDKEKVAKGVDELGFGELRFLTADGDVVGN